MVGLLSVIGWMSPSQLLCACVGVCLLVHMRMCVFPQSRQTVFVHYLFFLFLHFEKIFGIEYFPSVLETLQSCGFPPQKAENES